MRLFLYLPDNNDQQTGNAQRHTMKIILVFQMNNLLMCPFKHLKSDISIARLPIFKVN